LHNPFLSFDITCNEIHIYLLWYDKNLTWKIIFLKWQTGLISPIYCWTSPSARAKTNKKTNKQTNLSNHCLL
jgi:hypothetical protein